MADVAAPRLILPHHHLVGCLAFVGSFVRPTLVRRRPGAQLHLDQPQWTQLRQPASRTSPGWLHFGHNGPSAVTTAVEVALAALGMIGSTGVRKPVSIMCRSMMSPIAATSDPTYRPFVH